MYIIGLTGNIATGKSTVLRYLQQKGAYVLDADQLAHQSMQPGTHAYRTIIETFGPTVLQPSGAIDRPRLGQIVFSDPGKLAQLEAIVHPAVFELARHQLAGVTAKVVILEAIKLLEAGQLVTLCDEIWVIVAEPARQLQRLRETRNMREDEARRRMAAQSPQAEKVKRADRVIDNNSTTAALLAQLDIAWADVLQKANTSM
ncbi:MAG: dephospho-CoA kinase [Caldilineaceae bacterium]|nr:dephospho-CoA kinase [Caldilineaceae bacterium]